MLKIKAGVRVEGLSREAWYAAGVMASLFSEMAGADAVMTAGTEGTHMPSSAHYRGDATDWRVRHVGSETAKSIFESAIAQLNPLGYDVLAEGVAGGPLTPFAKGAHLHIEFDPKKGEVFIHETA